MRAFTRCYRVAGCRLAFTADGQSLLDRTVALIDGWHFEPDSWSETAFSLELITGTEGAPAFSGDFFPVHHGECVVNDERLLLHTSGSWIDTESFSPRLRVHVGVEASDATAFSRLMFYAVQTALRRCGVFELHAGGVVAPGNGAGALIIGESGSGKTTITMRLAGCGWKYLSDDVVLLRNGSAGIDAFPFRRVFAANEPTLSVCRPSRIAEATRPAAEFEPEKKRLDPVVLYPHQHVVSAVPRTLFFSTIAAVPLSTTRRVTAAHAYTRLMRMCPWSVYDVPVVRAHSSVLARLAQDSRAFELIAGRDFLEDSDRAARILGSLVESDP